MTEAPPVPATDRSHYIPPRKADLLAALTEDMGPAGREDAGNLVRMLSAVFHFEYHDELEELHEAYRDLDPTSTATLEAWEVEAAYGRLSATLERVLRGANFIEISPDHVAEALEHSGKIRYAVRTGADDFRAIRLFRRGSHHEDFERRSLLGLRRKTFDLDVYDEVVLIAALRATPPANGRRRRRRPVGRPGSVIIKLFHDIPTADLEALYPDARVVMTLRDKLTLGLPALFGGIPLAIKLAPAILVLYGLIRYYTGDASAADGDSLGEALIVAGGVIGLGGFLMQQWVKYERQALRYQKEVNDLVYFHNVTNNVGLFDHLIGIAEQQEVKEALLAYLFLLKAPAPVSEATLDAEIESWLHERFGLEVDFECNDGLAKLERLGLVLRTGEALSALPVAAALRELDRRWDAFFPYAADAPAVDLPQASGYAQAAGAPTGT
jgi:hypothetical protein